MSRVVLYMVADNGRIVPIRNAYRKARYRKKVGRKHECHEFRKNRTKSNNRYTKDELLDYFKHEIQQEDDFTNKVQTAIAADLLIRAIFGEDNQSDQRGRELKSMCIYEPLHGEYPTEEQCKSGCEECPFNVPDIPKSENEQDELPY